MFTKEIFDKYFDFQWDGGNDTKNWDKHDVSQVECEQAFFNFPAIFMQDIRHSHEENRYCLFGQSMSGRKLCLIFTMRLNVVPIISARDMNQKERMLYEEAQKNTKI